MKFLAIVLTIIFVVARIMNLITWSWWLVLSPALIYCAVWLLVLLIAIIIALVMN
ncbi:hypothetical protein RP299_03980 [Lactobacillus johnsonii]|uniref:hypothetical protein n=1 Tax=Lactobacillus johnsonii TaxID=33959 RepID=UPI0028FC2BFC|nr:hypothetical protein [Lactobacillus johnsonii]WNW29487.1 hypothetical protein RP299_03980 [Lactobacillus johnsonii]